MLFSLRNKGITLKNLNENLCNLLKPHLLKQNAYKIGIFGSYASNEQDINSDLDVLVSFSNRKSLLDLVGIEGELSEH